jgi:hypothetical protein
MTVAAVIALLGRTAPAQEVGLEVGPVLDAETLEPVAGAEVRISAAQRPAGSCTTDAAGRCRLATPTGGVTIRVTATGYELFEEDVTAAGELRDRPLVLLRPGAISGEVIEVQARPSDARPVSPGSQELTREQLVHMPGARGDALQSVKSLAGVSNVDAVASGAGALVIRGAAPEDSKISIDGIEVPLAYHFFGLQSILPSEFIDALDFQPGGFGVDEGRSTGGVLDITTRAERPDRVGGFVETSFINLAGLVQTPIAGRDDLHLALAARRSMIDVLLPLAAPEDSGVAFVTAPTYYDAQLRVDYRPGFRHRVTALGLASYDLLSLLNENEDPNEPIFTGKWENENTFTRAILSWHYDGDRVKSRLSGAAGTSGIRIEVGEDRYVNFDTRRIEVREDATVTVTDRLGLRAGGELRYSILEEDSRFPLPPHEGSGQLMNWTTASVAETTYQAPSHVAAAYLAGDLRPFERLTVTSGLRVDHYARFDDTTLSPRAAVQVRLSPRVSTRVAVGSYSRQAEQTEAIDQDLDAELSTQYVAGGEVQVLAWLTTSLNGFYTDRRKLIVLDPVQALVDPEHAYVNRGSGRSIGGELVLKARMDHFAGWIAYTLSKSERRDGPLSDLRLFDYDQTHNLTAVGSWSRGAWKLGARWQYATGIPTTPIVGTIYNSDHNIHLPVLGEVNSERLPASHQLDLRVDRLFDLRHIDLSVFLDVSGVYAHPRVLGYTYNFDYTEREAIRDVPILPALGVRGSF